MLGDSMWIDIALLAVLALLLVVSYAVARKRSRRLQGALAATAMPADDERKRVEFHPYRTLIRQAGIRGRAAIPTLWMWKVFFAALFPLVRAEFALALDVGEAFNLTSIFLGVLGFFTPELWLMRRRRARQLRVRSSLSYFLDLTVALLRSGLNLERALLRAGTHGFKPRHPLGIEVQLLADELRMGKDRPEAFSSLAERTGVADLRVLAAALRMSAKLGAPIEDALEAQADALRARLREWTLKRINRMTVTALFPVFLCGLPVFAVIVYFPAFLSILESVKGLR